MKKGKKQLKKKKKKKISFKLERITDYRSFYEQILKIRPLVAEILKKDVEARDDDNVLLVRVWQRLGIKDNTSFKKFKFNLIMGKLSLPESVMRSRRALQEKYPSLRGELYEPRKKAEKAMNKQMKLDF